MSIVKWTRELLAAGGRVVIEDGFEANKGNDRSRTVDDGGLLDRHEAGLRLPVASTRLHRFHHPTL